MGTRRSSLPHTQPLTKPAPRSLSSESHKAAWKQKKMSPKSVAQNVVSPHSRGRILSKAAKETKGPRSKSLTYKARPSLIRIGSWGSMKSTISIMSDDRSSSGEKSSSNQDRKKKKSSIHSRGIKDDKEKSQSIRSRSASKSSRRNQSQSKRSTSEKKTPTRAEKKKVKSGPTPSPNPRRRKLEVNDDDLEGGSYLTKYDANDFDTVNGDSDVSSTPTKKSDESKIDQQIDLNASPKGRDEPPKKPMRRKRRDLQSETINDAKNKRSITPKRKSRTLKSKLLRL